MLLLPLVLAYLSSCLVVSTQCSGRREAIVYGSLPFSVALVAITELLGAFHELTPVALSVAWTIVACGYLALFLRMRGTAGTGWRTAVEPVKDCQRVSKFWAVLLGCSTGLVIIVGITAFLGAPNVWDAMQYHLPRVVEWATYRSVDFYPTQDYQQLFAPPFAEFSMLHAFLLFGGDSVVSLVQWFAWIGSILGTTLIARHLGANVYGQMLTAIISATIPGAVLSASGPKNDCVVAFWIIVTVSLLLLYRRRPTWIVSVGIGCSLGLAILTKGTAYVFLPCLFVGAFMMWPEKIQGQFLRRAALVLVCAAALNAPQFIRNRELSDSILGFSSPDGNGRKPWRNERITIRATLENVIRELVSHVNVHSAHLNEQLNARSRSLMVWLGLDPDDPASTWVGHEFKIFPYLRNEIHAGSPFQLALFLLILVLMLLRPRHFSAEIIVYSFAIAGSFLMFCMLIRYQEGAVRFHLPLLLLASPSVAIGLSEYCSNWMLETLAAMLILLAVPQAMLNDLRPLITRSGANPSIIRTARARVYFYDSHQEAADSYIQAVEAVTRAGCHSVGIDASQEHFEYPLFALLRAGLGNNQIVYSGVSNHSAVYKSRYETIAPCAVICPGCAAVPGKLKRYDDRGQSPLLFGSMAVWVFEAKN